MHIVDIDSDGSVACASCESHWSIPLIAELRERGRLRAEGFAHIWFADGAICLNHCPHCERPLAPMEAPCPISPVF